MIPGIVVGPLGKIALTVILASAAYLAWTWHGDHEYERGKHELQALYDAEAKKVTELRKEIGKIRDTAAQEAAEKYITELNSLKEQHETLANLARDRAVTIDRLRSTAAVRAREVNINPDDPCRAPKLRAQAADRLLAEGQGLAIEGAGLVDAFAGLVDQGEISLGEHAALIKLAQAWAKSVKIGSD